MCELDRYNSSDSVYVGERFGMFVDKPNGCDTWRACTRVTAACKPRGSAFPGACCIFPLAMRQCIGRSASAMAETTLTLKPRR